MAALLRHAVCAGASRPWAAATAPRPRPAAAPSRWPPNGVPSATWPHTTSRDAFAIALGFDTAIDDHLSGAMLARWIVESDLLAGEPEDSTEPYLGNRSFWETLAAATVELDRVHAPLPALSLVDDATPRAAMVGNGS